MKVNEVNNEDFIGMLDTESNTRRWAIVKHNQGMYIYSEDNSIKPVSFNFPFLFVKKFVNKKDYIEYVLKASSNTSKFYKFSSEESLINWLNETRSN